MSNGDQSPQEGQQAEVQPQAITPGTAILGTATIDSLFTALYATRSADIVAAGAPTYSWARDNMIIAQWPALQTSPTLPGNYSAMFCTFHARGVLGSSIGQ
jgi:hypothetical protein